MDRHPLSDPPCGRLSKESPGSKKARWPLPNGPGLGIRLNEDLIKEHPYRPVQSNLFAEGWQRRFSEPVKDFERIRQ